MDIDERIERLTARHEALARSMEITHRDIQDLFKASEQQTTQIHGLLTARQLDGENIRSLALIAEMRDRRPWR